ncbi:guanine nucleotide-binding protein g(o) subunit alpha [Anaeramoeba flamelloides]|uniref:Guanine nucleotide-binding protein g(O) subunit alpha n=1 Tax=Anaeramoeba flamelloides TaxID=1746091 RepID=A0ABQ8YFV1_9EUKA|nr:guanine nucleotide-binding protein g(o) subunit alpha [Anaeramoeba flamelloides]
MGNRKNREKHKSIKTEKSRNRRIEKSIKKEESHQGRELKLLLLGTGDSGKSTFVKQMQILYKNGFSEKELSLYLHVIRLNTKNHMKVLLKASHDMDLELSEESQEIKKKFLTRIRKDPVQWNKEIIKEIKQLWEDPKIKEAFEQKHLFQIPSSAGVFLDKIDEIAKDSYKPTETDILNCRIPTTGVKELIFEVNNFHWKLVDVGGQRSERRKWIHHFDDVDILIFVIALDGYAQKLFEDHTVNRMIECFSVFEQTVNNQYFKSKDLVLLLNKIDLFKKNLKIVPLNKAFPDYEGENKYKPASKYFSKKFNQIVKKKNRKVTHHFTCGVNTEMIKVAFQDIKGTIVKKFVKDVF